MEAGGLTPVQNADAGVQQIVTQVNNKLKSY